jgi:DNA-binding SARP family transcriptional activator/tetratricopeptide (TPR) repeat protein
MASVIVFRLFGACDLRTVADVRASSVLAQLKHVAFLAIAAGARDSLVRRDRVVGLLWPELDDNRARNALSKATHNCRRALGEEALVGRFAEEIGLNAARWSVDLWEFESAIDRGAHQEALELFRRGEFMEGFHVPDASALEHWIDGERDRLRRRAIGAATALADKAERAGDEVSAAEHLRIAIELTPFDERILRRRLTLLDRNGDRAGAISAFTRFAEGLQRELDSPPSPETIALLESLKGRVAVSVATTPDPVQPTRVGDSPPVPASHTETIAPSTASEEQPRASQPWSRIRRHTSVVIAGGVALASIVWSGSSPSRNRTPHAILALMPVEVARSDSTLALLQWELGAAVEAQVVAMGRVTMLRVSDLSAARRAGASHLVSASVESANDSLLVRARILRALDGQAAVVFNAIGAPRSEARSIIRVVSDRIGGAVAALSDSLYLAWALAGSRTPSYAAYQAFGEALESIVLHDPHRPVQTIVDQLTMVSRLDPSFAAARVLLIEQSDFDPSLRTFSDSVQAVAVEQRGTLGAYDTAALDNIVAIRAGNWEAALAAARRMVSIAPSLPDAHFAMARAQMATRRYRGALASLTTIARQRAWFTQRPELWQWDLAALHALGEYEIGVKHFEQVAARYPDDYFVCLWGIPDLVALGREAAVDSMVTRCASIVGGKGAQGPAKIPNRAYFSHVIPHYLAHGNRDAAIRAAARVRPGFEKYASAEPPKARDLATIDCMLGDWTACYPPLAKSTYKSQELHEYALRRLGAAAARVGDSSQVSAALRATDSAATLLHRGYALMSRAMIYAAGGQRDRALVFLARAGEAGLSPTGTEWIAWPGPPELLVGWVNDWYHAYELAPLRGDPVFEAMLRARKD